MWKKFLPKPCWLLMELVLTGAIDGTHEVPTNMALMAFSDSEWKGLGFVSYNAVSPPPTRLFLPPNLDLSNSGLEEFQQPEFEGYGPKTRSSTKKDKAMLTGILARHMTGTCPISQTSRNLMEDMLPLGEEPKEGKLLVKELLKRESNTKPLNRVLVVKPHNKTLYELFRGKFDGKSDEGFFVGYSLNSKAFRVYNIRTRKVEENLHIRFLEDKPIIAGTNSNDLVGTEESIGTGHSSKETGSSQDYILMPLWKDGSLFDSSSKNASIEHNLTSYAGKKDDEGTRRMTKTLNEQGFISAVYEGKTHEDLHTCLFACFLSQVEPKKGYTQEEGIDYDEVFAPVARIEAIGFEDPEFPDRVYNVKKALYGRHQAPRAWYETLSTYLLDNGFHRGQIDKTLFIKRVKGDILLVQIYVDDIIFGSTRNEMCTEFENMMHKKFQMSSMGELTFFLGLQTASTPMETSKPLLKDAEDEDVDVHLYRSMIGSLMYLTASRPDIMGLFVCACARFQAHLNDYAGASLDRKSTTGGCQFIGSRLISWQYKKQTIVANSTTKVEYVAVASCCGQVLWIQNQMLDYGYNFMNTKIFIDNERTICIVKNPVFHSKTKNIEIRHHFIRDSNEKKLIQMIKIHTDQKKLPRICSQKHLMLADFNI
ncbi:putative ribonuclease H-like domain-containing protein [Tanacetum coccineum]